MNSLTEKFTLNQFSLLIHAVGGLVILGSLIVVWICFIQPMQNQMLANQVQLEVFNQLGEQHSKVKTLNTELSSQLQLAKTDMDTILQKISKKLVIDQFLQKIGDLAEQHEVHIQEFRPGTLAAQGDYQALTVSLSLTGPFAGICKFFNELEEFNRLNRVKSAQISPQGTEGGNCTVSLIIELYTKTPVAIAVQSREKNDV